MSQIYFILNSFEIGAHVIQGKSLYYLVRQEPLALAETDVACVLQRSFHEQPPSWEQIKALRQWDTLLERNQVAHFSYSCFKHFREFLVVHALKAEMIWLQTPVCAASSGQNVFFARQIPEQTCSKISIEQLTLLAISLDFDSGHALGNHQQPAQSVMPAWSYLRYLFASLLAVARSVHTHTPVSCLRVASKSRSKSPCTALNRTWPNFSHFQPYSAFPLNWTP